MAEPRETITKGMQVQTDGRTVWVNGPRGSIARFTHHACEVNGPESMAMDWAGQATWEEWCKRVMAWHNVVVPDDYQPEKTDG